SSSNADDTDDSNMQNLDMDLSEQDENADNETIVDKEKPIPNIWTLDNGDDEQAHGTPIVGGVDDDELEKPSFLRRLGRRGKSKAQKTDDISGDTEDNSDKKSE
ncbi:hypothetical protein KC957_00575, partial [Candidatus Saccharibacteria bacterium]|nr:hypothetical protein [Candidatus Saccharibacteria bacterium]